MCPEELHDVVHVDRYVGNNAINNLAPLRSLEESQYFKRYLLHNIANLEWWVTVSSKHDQDYSRYLISENGLVFSLIRKIFSKQDVASGYAYCYFTALDGDPVLSDQEEKETKKDESRKGANVQVHVLVAAT